jgi:hypothetical protein
MCVSRERREEERGKSMSITERKMCENLFGESTVVEREFIHVL